MGQATKYFGYALNSVAAAGADAVLDNGILTLTGVGQIPYQKIQNGPGVDKQIYVAPVARVSQLTITAPPAVGTNYQVNFSQPQPDGGVSNQIIAVTSLVGGTASSITAGLKSAFDALVLGGVLFGTAVISGSSSEIITFTAGITAPMLRVTGITSTVITLSVTAAGNPAINTGAQLIAQNVVGALAANNYTTYTIPYTGSNGGSTGSEGPNSQLVYAINEGDTNAAALITKLDNLLSGSLPSSPGIANPEAFGNLI